MKNKLIYKKNSRVVYKFQNPLVLTKFLFNDFPSLKPAFFELAWEECAEFDVVTSKLLKTSKYLKISKVNIDANGKINYLGKKQVHLPDKNGTLYIHIKKACDNDPDAEKIT